MIQDLDLTLSRRAVAAGWEWQAGALLFVEDWREVRLVHQGADGDWHGVILSTGRYMRINPDRDYLPDFNDAATRGVLFQQVRERGGNPYMYLSPLERPGLVVEWRMVWMVPPGESGGYKSWEGPTETAALVAALEAAQKR